MAEEMHDAASQYLAQVEDERIASNPTVFQVTTDLLACMVSFSSPTQKLVLEKLAQHHVVGSSSSSLPTLFKILRHLKTSNVQLCDKFWSRTLRHMEEIPTEREDYKLFRVSHRYMHFNNNLGGTYRHYELEKQMIEWLWNEVKTGSAGVMPSKFARAAAFILAYGNIGQGKTAVAESTLTQMMHKLMDMAPQFSKLDCMYISRGLQIGAVLGYQKRAMTSQFLDVFRNIDTVMNNCTLEYLKDKEIALPDLNRMIKAYICRRGMHGTELFERLMQRYENFSGELCSRQLRDIANNLLSTNCLVPSILDQLVNYVLENGNHILGDTMVKLLYVCYSLGYMPTQAEKFFPVASSIISRDKERLQGLVLLNAAIALCFFHQLPEDLVHFIFTVSFLERLDEEVLNCYAKASYPTRIRHAMMQVNRAVCLDYPEADVPWFHEKYCEQITSLESPRQSSFRDDVYHSLVSVIGAENLVQTNKYSPYFYRIDFQVLLNKNEKPVTLRHQTDSNVTKLAVLLWDKTAYTNGVIQLCGEQQLKQRHLEMLGYRVIGINSSVWNSMYMAEQKTKTDYLKEQIWPSSTDSVLHHQKKS
ncbi:FAST kinase domain-containing protein 1, mitochondrial isoform X2 [Periplaneta americana]